MQLPVLSRAIAQLQFYTVESIRDWLNSSRNYNVGLALYLTYGDNQALKTALQQGESKYRKDKLLQALREIWEANKKTARVNPLPLRVLPLKTGGESKQTYTPAQPDHDKDPYYNDWQPLYKEMMHLRSQLALLPNDIERGQAAFRILFLEKTCRKYWAMRDYFYKTGTKMPEDSGLPDMVTDYNALTKRLMTLRTYKTRETNKLKPDPMNLPAKQRLDKWLKEMQLIELKLAEI